MVDIDGNLAIFEVVVLRTAIGALRVFGEGIVFSTAAVAFTVLPFKPFVVCSRVWLLG